VEQLSSLCKWRGRGGRDRVAVECKDTRTGWNLSYDENTVINRKPRPKPALSEVERAKLGRGTLEIDWTGKPPTLRNNVSL
jgi:hypothetical protein